MKRFLSACLAAGAFVLGSGLVHADDDGTVQEFATLPSGVRYPEGIAANPATGDVFVATFDFGPNANSSFEGVGRDGRANGLLFPASMAIHDGWMYVTNLALPLTATVGDEPEEDVTRWTVARVRVPRR